MDKNHRPCIRVLLGRESRSNPCYSSRLFDCRFSGLRNCFSGHSLVEVFSLAGDFFGIVLFEFLDPIPSEPSLLFSTLFSSVVRYRYRGHLASLGGGIFTTSFCGRTQSVQRPTRCFLFLRNVRNFELFDQRIARCV